MKTNQLSNVQSSLIRIGATDPHIVQFMDYPDFNDPQGRHVFLINFRHARLADVDDHEIFSGQIIIRVNCEVTPISLAIINRLLHNNARYFGMVVNGSYSNEGSYAEVYADDVPWTNIQLDIPMSASELKIIQVSTLVSE